MTENLTKATFLEKVFNFENNQETKKERKKNQREISQRSQRGERRKRNIRGPRILVPIRGIFLIIIAHIVI